MSKFDVQPIRENLWLGSLQGAKEALDHPQSRFTHVVSCLESRPELKPGIVQLHIPVADEPNNSLLEHFKKIGEFISNVKQTDHVLVHCEMGISRSAAVVAGYLIQSEQLNVKQALQAVYAKRPIAKVNPWFVNDLRTWQQQLLD